MEKKCVVCGKEFETRYTQTICCSFDCARVRHREKQSGKKSIERFKIFKRDNFACVYCGKNVFEDGIKLEVDHLIPKVEGGKDNTNNLITSCRECNREKSKFKLSEEIKEKIKNKILKSKLKGGQNGEAF